MQIKVNRFVLDVCMLISHLDQIGRRDRLETRRAVVEKGEAEYQELLERQHSLTLTPEDTRMIQTMLTGMKARLKFLL
jgi:hypothetical protein